MSENNNNHIIIGTNIFYRLNDEKFINVSKITSIELIKETDSACIKFKIDNMETICIWEDYDSQSYNRAIEYFKLEECINK